MKEILDGEHVILVDDEDYDRVMAHKWTVYRSYKNRFYAHMKRGVKTVYLHRFITNAPDGMVVDHKNGNGLDNRRGNLRVTIQQNNVRNRPGSGSNTGFKGVSYSKERRKFYACIQHDGRTIGLGRYESAEEAARAYDAAAKKHYGEFAWLNFPAD